MHMVLRILQIALNFIIACQYSACSEIKAASHLLLQSKGQEGHGD